MKRILSLFVAMNLALLMMACPKTNVSQQVAIGRAFASAPVAFKAVKDAAAVLVSEKALTADAQVRLNQVLNKAEASVEQIAGDVQAGKFDPQAWDRALQNVIDEFKALQPILLQNLDPRWREWTDLAMFLIPQIKAIVDAIKPPNAPATPTIHKDGSGKAAITPGGIAALTSISIAAAIQIVAIERDGNADSLWNRFHAAVNAYHGR